MVGNTGNDVTEQLEQRDREAEQHEGRLLRLGGAALLACHLADLPVHGRDLRAELAEVAAELDIDFRLAHSIVDRLPPDPVLGGVVLEHALLGCRAGDHLANLLEARA
jgi:hypothetical protein